MRFFITTESELSRKRIIFVRFIAMGINIYFAHIELVV